MDTASSSRYSDSRLHGGRHRQPPLSGPNVAAIGGALRQFWSPWPRSSVATACRLNVMGSMAIGWGVTAIVHLVFGSPLGLPSTDDVDASAAGARRRRSRRTAVKARDGGWRSTGRAASNRRRIGARSLAISVYGRDATDAKLLSKAGRFLLYRDSGPTLTLTRLQQVEREAYSPCGPARSGLPFLK